MMTNPTSKSFRKGSLALLFSLGLSGAAQAQSTTQGAISGTVFDSTDAAVPNATILIHNDGTNADLNLTSDGSGFYKAPQLAPGTYTVTINAAGFGTQRSSNVVVEVNLVTTVSPHLATGGNTQVVEVTAEVPVLKFDTPSYGGQLSNTEIENIPINNRRWSSLSLLTPGVTNDAQGFGLISFRAIQPQLNNVQIDGADDNQVFYGEERGRTRAGYSTAQTAIREFQINTGVYSSEFGRAVGGVINSVTKSGTNQIHGEAYFYHRDQQWGASNNYVFKVAYDPTTSIATKQYFKAKDKRNQYGFGIGGPLIKDKLFFFYAFDQFRRVFPGTASAANVAFYSDPTAAQLTTLATRLTNGGNGTTTSAQALATYRNYIGILNSDLGALPRIGFQIINTPKLDYQLNQKNHVSALYHRLRWDSPGGVQTQSVNNYGVDGFGNDFVKLDYGIANLDTVLNAHTTNSLRYQYGRELNYETAQTPSAFTQKYLTGPSGLAPQVTTNGGNAFITGLPYYSFRPALPDERKWQIGDTAILQLGNHSIKFGLDIVHNDDVNNTLGYSGYSPNGTYTYNTPLDYISDLAANNHGGCGSVAAPVGCYQTYRQTVGPASFEFATVDYGFFLQDDWKITPRLTLNLGARYDYESIPNAFSNLGIASNPAASNSVSDKNNISPRVGFAWDPYGTGKTAIRGGFGMYYGRIPNVALLTQRFSTGSTNGQLSYSVTPTATTPRLPTQPVTGITSVPDVQAISSNFQNPYTEQFDFAFQQDLGWNTVLSVSYLGSLGRELPNSLNLNIDPSKSYNVNYLITAGTNGSCGPLVCGTTITQKVYGQKVVTAVAGTNITTAPSTLNTSYNNIYTGISNVNSAYHAITAEVQKRANKYISYDANYTWSHALDYNQTSVTGFGFNNWFDPYTSARSNYGNSYLNVKHRAVGWAIFNIPGFHSHHLEQATNGWSIKPALQIQSGLPYSANASPTPAPQCNLVGCLQANNSGIAGTGVTYIPQLGRNTFNYPRDISLDLRLQKDFKITERFNFQLIGESFNVANHQNVTGINTTAYSAGTNVVAGNTSSNSVTPLVYSPTFGAVTNSNNNYAYGPRTIQVGGRLFF